MRILLLEPYLTDSHVQWAQGYQRHSAHQVEVMGLRGSHWKWRMHGAAVTLARQFLSGSFQPELILASDMLDVATFLALTRTRTAHLPVALYFHENQLTYPWSPTDQDVVHQRDRHYAWLNFTSALAADRLFFNSQFHQNRFLAALPAFLTAFPDHQELGSVEAIAAKAQVLPLGLELKALDQVSPPKLTGPPIILWNHRWEYDKRPEAFFELLFDLKQHKLPFRLIVLGKAYQKQPPIFTKAKAKLKDRIVHWGYAEKRTDYAYWLKQADILPVTSYHDFFGASVVEAIYGDCYPLLPNELAYPEHIPANEQDTYLYTPAKGALKDALLDTILNNRVVSPLLKQHVSVYDWSVQAPLYDLEMAAIIN